MENTGRRWLDKIDPFRKGLQATSLVPNCHRLPPEVLSIVFLGLLDNTEKRIEYSASDQIAVSHVCQYWRAVALDCPVLWASPDFSHPALAEVMLSRSKNAPLTVAYNVATIGSLDMQLQSARLRALQTALSQGVDRLCCVRLSFNYLNIRISTLFSSWTFSPPLLQEFSICGHWVASEGQEIPAIELLRDAPSLRHLDLQLRTTLWTTLPFNQNLTHLELHKACSSYLWPEPGEFLTSLGRMPRLRVLGLFDALPVVDEHDSSPMCLPDLRELALQDHILTIGYFFQAIQLPNLDSVCVVTSEVEEGEVVVDQVVDTLEDLTNSIGYVFDSPRSVDRARVSNSSLELCLVPGPQTKGSLSKLTIADCMATSPVTIYNYLDVLNPLFKFAALNALELDQTISGTLCEEAWVFFGSLTNLRSITFQAAPVGGFFDTLDDKPDPPLPHDPAAPYFPALSTLRFSSLELDEEEYELNAQALVGRLIKILRRRVKRGFSLAELHLEDFGHLRESDVSRLRKAVPSLQVVWDGYTSETSDWDWEESDGDGDG